MCPAADLLVAGEAEHRPYVGEVVRDQFADRERRVGARRNGGLTAVSVLPQHVVADADRARPVLRVDDEHTARSDDQVVDVREAAGKRSGPMDIIVLETLVSDDAGTPVQTIRQTFVAKR